MARVGDGRAVFCAIVCTLLWSAWMSLSRFPWWPTAIQSPIESYYAGLLGHIILFVVGYGLGLILPKRERDLKNATVWTQDGLPLD